MVRDRQPARDRALTDAAGRSGEGKPLAGVVAKSAREGMSPEDAARHPLRWVVLFGVWCVYFSFGLTVSGLAPLIGPITADLAISHTNMGGILGIWQLVFIVASIPCGMLIDRVGVRLAILLGAFIMALSGYLRGVADDAVLLYVAVALFGIGGPIVSAGAPKAVTRWFRGSERGFAMGVYFTGPNLGAITALSLTNSVMMPLFDGDWRFVLQFWALVALASGLVWLVIASLPLVRAQDESEDRAARTSPVRGAIREMIAHPAVRILLLLSVGIFLVNHSFNNWLPEILRSFGMSAVEAGYWAAIPTLIGIVGSLIIPRLAIPERRLAILGGLVAAAFLGCVLVASAYGPALFLGLVMLGIARSSLMTVSILTLVETKGVGPRLAGLASGLFFTAAEVGGALGPLGMGLLFDATGDYLAGLFTLAAVCILMLVGILVLARLREA